MVGVHQVVVDGLGHVDHDQRPSRGAGLGVDALPRVRGVVATNDEQISDIVFGQDIHDGWNVFGLELASGRPEHGTGRPRDPVPPGLRLP